MDVAYLSVEESGVACGLVEQSPSCDVPYGGNITPLGEGRMGRNIICLRVILRGAMSLPRGLTFHRSCLLLMDTI
jgi:hypothetical protein